jgi:hypothetical protein
MIGALVYLQLTSLKNALRARIQRLRQPKYLLAALVGAAYFYFFFFRHVAARHSPLQGRPPLPVETVDWPGLLEPLGALALFVAVAVAWILPNSRAALAFTEPEVAFLFPAPVTRRTLVYFKLIKSQLSILISSLILTLISNRWTFLGGSMWMHAVGWWLVFSMYNLHLIGASFARTRLLDFGLDVRRRRIAAVGMLIALGVVTWFWLRRTLPAPSDADLSSAESLIDYVKAVLASPPLAWVLLPFRLVVRPFLAGNLPRFISVLWPALLLLALHYLWVVRSDVAFEEASVALSQKRAERQAAMRAGKWTIGAPAKKRREPFVLSAKGAPSIAFLWKSLIAAGPLYYPKNWLFLGVALAGGAIWLGHDPIYRPFLTGIGAFSGALIAYGLFFGPVLSRRGTGQMLERFDLLKSYPVRGWQAVLGELLCPVTILCAFEWVCLTILALAIGFSRPGGAMTPVVTGTGAVSAALLMVPLVGLLFALNFAGILYFPAWLSNSTQQGAGIEKVGQRLIFFVGYLVVLVGALLPAAGFGAVPFLLVWLFSDQLALAIALGAVTACAALVGELAVAIWWLGRRFERFDLSVEMPR